jgi:hypothetical protein
MMKIAHKTILVPMGEEITLPETCLMVTGSVWKLRADGGPPDIEVHYIDRTDMVPAMMAMPGKTLTS